ncbi:hypothetical protein DPEC_G00337850 [Dallia pectoralis]|uniref:Uncharacterized protein n=1 Tax=Dallia pectoralis TaxID=75939 RepID=A0ACC2F4S1_DALPE|nr:hypothetical protein DPEC_G00337850 [Dallia pectoralis]
MCKDKSNPVVSCELWHLTAAIKCLTLTTPLTPWLTTPLTPGILGCLHYCHGYRETEGKCRVNRPSTTRLFEEWKIKPQT